MKPMQSMKPIFKKRFKKSNSINQVLWNKITQQMHLLKNLTCFTTPPVGCFVYYSHWNVIVMFELHRRMTCVLSSPVLSFFCGRYFTTHHPTSRKFQNHNFSVSNSLGLKNHFFMKVVNLMSMFGKSFQRI